MPTTLFSGVVATIAGLSHNLPAILQLPMTLVLCIALTLMMIGTLIRA